MEAVRVRVETAMTAEQDVEAVGVRVATSTTAETGVEVWRVEGG